jgi:lipopolysaccharide biosynthesis protein
MKQITDNNQPAACRPRFIAYYLPQFHPIPENDLWWGKGFTEWTNATKAAPLFKGHYQPHLPADLGFYDLRVRETRLEQVALAKQYGIDGFCYHYYWFSGKRLLERPLDEMLADPAIDMPFCLCWANENWTRRWDAAEHEVLIAQQESPDDDHAFIKSVEPFLRDPRYIRVDGAPLLVVYRPQNLRNPRRSSQVWREYCRQGGIGPIHLCAALTHGNFDYLQFGFDSGVEFPPHNLRIGNINAGIDFYDPFVGNVIDFRDLARSYLQYRYQGRVFKTVFPSWDNTARTGSRALIVLHATPENYEWWLAKTVEQTREGQAEGDQLVFINAWNEWAEGCHLEPDRRYGRAFLEATLRVKQGISPAGELTADVSLKQGEGRRTLGGDLSELLRYHSTRNIMGRAKTLINRYPRIKALVIKILQMMRIRLS